MSGHAASAGDSPLPTVGVVILSWNDAESLTRCLRSLGESDYPEIRVLVVDNASERYDARDLCAPFPGVEVIVNEVNRGVAGGRNVGLARLLERKEISFIFFLDDDTEQEPDMIRKLVEAWNPEEGRAILGPAIYELQSPETLTSLGGRWNGYTGRSRHVLVPPAGVGRGTEPFPLDFVIGCAFFTHRSVFERIGPFDEDFSPYYAEDIELCLRAREHGLRSVCVPGARVRHRVSHAAGGVRFNPRYAFNKGQKTVLLMKKHAAPLEWVTFLAAQSFFLAGAALREGLRGNIGAVGALIRGMTTPAARGGWRGPA